MTPEEAIDRLKTVKLLADGFDLKTATKMAIEALEKQIPKKPEDSHHCPSCGWGMPVPEISDNWCKCCYFPNFCQHCGQNIDWGFDEK